MVYSEYNEDYGRSEFGSFMDGELNKYNALQSLLTGKQLENEEVETLREFPIVQKFLSSPIGDQSEPTLKKVFATAIAIANEQGKLPFKIDSNSLDLASAVDEALTRIKTSYKVTQGELDIIEAVDLQIDAIAARVVSAADNVIERAVPVALDKLCLYISKVYPPAAIFTPIIKESEKFLISAAKVAVRKGVTVLAEGAKTALRNVATYTKRISAKLKSYLFG